MSVTPLKAIRIKCLSCMCDELLEIKACSVTKCSLWPFRLGIHPYTKKNKDNPFLQAKNLEGTQYERAPDVVKRINSFKGGPQ